MNTAVDFLTERLKTFRLFENNVKQDTAQVESGSRGAMALMVLAKAATGQPLTDAEITLLKSVYGDRLPEFAKSASAKTLSEERDNEFKAEYYELQDSAKISASYTATLTKDQWKTHCNIEKNPDTGIHTATIDAQHLNLQPNAITHIDLTNFDRKGAVGRLDLVITNDSNISGAGVEVDLTQMQQHQLSIDAKNAGVVRDKEGNLEKTTVKVTNAQGVEETLQEAVLHRDGTGLSEQKNDFAVSKSIKMAGDTEDRKANKDVAVFYDEKTNTFDLVQVKDGKVEAIGGDVTLNFGTKTEELKKDLETFRNNVESLAEGKLSDEASKVLREQNSEISVKFAKLTGAHIYQRQQGSDVTLEQYTTAALHQDISVAADAMNESREARNNEILRVANPLTGSKLGERIPNGTTVAPPPPTPAVKVQNDPSLEYDR